MEEENCDKNEPYNRRAYAIMSIRKLNTLGRIMTPNRTIGFGGGRPRCPYAQIQNITVGYAVYRARNSPLNFIY